MPREGSVKRIPLYHLQYFAIRGPSCCPSTHRSGLYSLSPPVLNLEAFKCVQSTHVGLYSYLPLSLEGPKGEGD